MSCFHFYITYVQKPATVPCARVLPYLDELHVKITHYYSHSLAVILTCLMRHLTEQITYIDCNGCVSCFLTRVCQSNVPVLKTLSLASNTVLTKILSRDNHYDHRVNGKNSHTDRH